MIYPISKTSLDDLFTLSFQYAWRALQAIFFLIVIAIIMKSLATYLPALPMPISITLQALLAAVLIFLYVMALYRVDGVLRETPVSFQQAWLSTLQSILKVYAACFMIAAVFLVFFVLARWLLISVLGLTGAPAGLAMLLLIGIPLILMVLYFYFTIPLLTVYGESLKTAFFHSPIYTQKRFVALILLYVELMIMAFVSSTHTRHSQWLISHHLMELADLLIFSLILPLAINLTLLVLHDIKLNLIPSPPLKKEG